MTSSPVTVVPVRSKAERDAFIDLPYRLHEGDPNWVPPLRMERSDALDPKKNLYLPRAETQLWIARRDGRALGRISAQIDPHVAERGRPEEGHFGFLAGEDDAEVFAALLQTAETWLAARGKTRAIGPLDFSVNQQTGLLVEGRETPPMLLMGHDLPYVATHLEAGGYAKARDVFAYLLDMRGEPPAPPAERKGLTVRPIDMADYKDEVRRIGEIFNDAWSENWGFVPLAPEEIEALAGELRPIVDKRLVWFAEYQGEPVCFLVCLPNVNAAIADLGGRLLPFGWAKLLWRLKVRGVTTARIPLMGLRRKHAGTMLGAVILGSLVTHVRRESMARGIEAIEMSWVLEDNGPMNAFARHIGGDLYKRYRIYSKAIA